MNKKRYFYITPEDYIVAENNGINKHALYQRVSVSGWDVDRAITQPIKKSVYKTGLWDKWKDKSVVCRNTFAYRVRKGMEPEVAASINFIEYKDRGRKQSVFSKEQIEEAASRGIRKQLLLQRYNVCGWSIEDCINKPKMSKNEAGMESVKKRKKNKEKGVCY